MNSSKFRDIVSLLKEDTMNAEGLDPLQHIKEGAHKDIVKVAKALVVDVPVDILVDEWNLLSLEEDKIVRNSCGIDTYWNRFFEMTKPSGDLKNPLVARIVKAALSLYHGSADIERGFSKSCCILTVDRGNMSERTLVAHLLVKDTLHHMYDSKIQCANVGNKLIEMARKAHVHNKMYCEEQHLIKEKDKNESILQKLRKEEKKKRIVSRTLLSGATKRLKEATEKNDMVAMNTAQFMIEVQKALKEEDKKNKHVDASQTKV
ncbi:hypothetical protein PR048_030668 [Dryococelus australis]|uniref:HAT C-terminal dimerisation domain-containing protein n=1 Tax=Dryococelus australis TaxID=614101 RepID=A0ABQ9G9J7_9NEOP|nr:hypothetical protein PR048_030668 [Dryococelus australis]